MSTTVAHDAVYFTSNGYPPLLRRPALILVQDPVDDPDERIQLRTRRRPAAAVSRRHLE